MKSSKETTKSSGHDETVQILMDLSRLIRNLSRVSGAAEEGPAMTATQRLALFELGEGGSLRLNDIADLMGVSPPTASRAVDALYELGLVERVQDARDRRALRIDLTSAGKELLAERKAKAQEAFAPAVASLSAMERATLSRLLRRMADEIRATRS
jgi:DNA-binding MarR family transcriptional regulator